MIDSRKVEETKRTAVYDHTAACQSAGYIVGLLQEQRFPHSSQVVCQDTPALSAALSLERLGLSVITLSPYSKVAARGRAWKPWQEKRPTPALLRRWWDKWPTCNIAVVTGTVSGIIVLDVDPRNGGDESLKGRHLPVTTCARTARGGFHYYYSTPQGVCIPKKPGLLPGLDLQAEGAYVVAPPSTTDAGAYTWAPGLSPEEVGFALCPEWVLTLSGQKAPTRPPAGTRALLPVFRKELPAGVTKGMRNATATRLAGMLLACGFSEEATLDYIWDWDKLNTPPMAGDPKEERKIRYTVQHLAAKEQKKPPGARGLRIPRELLKRNLSDGQIILAAQFLTYAQEKKKPPSWRDAAQSVGVDPSTVWRWRRAQAQVDARSETGLDPQPTQSYFPIPRGLLFDSGLSIGARVTALRLASFMNNGTARVSQEILARLRGLSSKQIRRHLRELEVAGHLETIREVYDPTLGRRLLPNRYHFTGGPNVAPVSYPSEAVYGGSGTETI